MASNFGSFYQRNWLLEEVLYLHGLWNQGPDGSPAVMANPRDTNPNISTSRLRPRSSVKFRKDRNRRSGRKKAVVPEKEWPTDSASAPSTVAAVGWPEPAPKRAPRALSAEDLASAQAARAQSNGVEACKIFFSKKDVDIDSEEGDEVGDVEEDDDVEEEEVEKRAFMFFMEILTNDNDLRRYYEANHEKGEFFCLVCEGNGVKRGRTFGNCTGLVQHCSNVAKKGRRAAHRGLAKTVCRVVGWNFDRLPMFVLDIEETLGQTLARNASTSQEEAQEAEEILINEVVD